MSTPPNFSNSTLACPGRLPFWLLLIAALGAACAPVQQATPAQAPAAAAGKPQASASAPSVDRLGPPAPASPSTGCTAGGGEAGEGTIRSGGHDAAYLITLPEGYDSRQPVPLVFAFHGRTRSHLTMHDGDAPRFAEEVGSRAIVAYVKSVGVGWDERSVAPFEALYDRVLSKFCVDTEQVFAAGHSSGAHFVHQLACTHSEQLRGIAAVAGGLERPECGGRTAALLIHGQRDAVVSISRGRHALAQVLARNRCEASTTALGVGACVRHDGCDAGLPVAWCEHSEPTYQDTNHGWPSFASAAVAAFFKSLGREPLPSGQNLLTSTDDEAIGRWQAQFATRDLGRAKHSDGAFCATVNRPGENPWDVQLGHGGLTLERGQRYRVDLRLRASAPTKVRLKLGLDAPPWGEVWVQTRSVGRESRRVSDEFVLIEDPPGAMGFAAQVAGPLVGALPVTVCLDDVWLSRVEAP